MEELAELRTCIEQQRYDDALDMIAELEEMSRDDKINRIRSYAIVLLLHLIKQQAEQRTTRSWDLSIYHARYQIWHTNRRRRAGGTYLDEAALRQTIHEAYRPALKRAALEVYEGQLDEAALATRIDRIQLEQQALHLVQTYQDEEEDEANE